MDFEMKVEQVSEECFVIALAGAVDLYAAPELKDQLLELLQHGARSLVVDLSAASFIDSTTLGILVGALRRLRQRDGELTLVCADQAITRIFEITGLDRTFDLYETRAAAIAKLPRLAVPA